MSEAYLGEVRIFAGQYAPQNWSLCNGNTLSVNQNQALFALIGTTYGGDGVNTFAIPDLRNRIPIGQGTGTVNGGQTSAGGGANLTQRTIGQTGGADAVTLTVANLPPHSHTFTVTTDPATSPTASNNYLAAAASTDTKQKGAYLPSTVTPAPTLAAMDPNFTDYAYGVAGGGTVPHANTMPYMVISYIIALQGIYPQRAN